MPTNPLTVGTSPRMASVFVCDVYRVSVTGFELLSIRKFYDKVGPAKAFRTSRLKRWAITVKCWKRIIANGQRPHLDYLVTRDVPDQEIWEIRVDVYELTPNGYRTIP